MKLIKEESRLGPGETDLKVVIESEKPLGEAIQDLQSLEAKQFALKAAADAGCVGAGISSLQSHPYAVDAGGKTQEDFKDPGAFQVHAYRIDFELAASLPFRSI